MVISRSETLLVLVLSLAMVAIAYAWETDSETVTRPFENSVADAGPTAQARTFLLPDGANVGLPKDARVNAAMFHGLSLSVAQGRAIAALSHGFERERQTILPARTLRTPYDSATKLSLLPFFERQRAAYRLILSPDQQARFDINTERILTAWMKADPSAGLAPRDEAVTDTAAERR
jgi:hypothetical protein